MVTLLTGGNPQIAKADGAAPVQAWIAASPGWKREASARIDALIARTLPGVRKAVKWNSPFYGVGATGWLLSMHHTNRYIKIAFFHGQQLEPLPPVPSKHPETRYLHVFEDQPIDEAQMADWLRQAAALPGVKM